MKEVKETIELLKTQVIIGGEKMRKRKFWQIQGLNAVSYLNKFLIRVLLITLYTFFSGLIIYSTPSKYNSFKLYYMGFFLIILSLAFNYLYQYHKTKETKKNEILGSMSKVFIGTAFDYVLLIIFYMNFLQLKTSMNEIDVLQNIEFYSLIGLVLGFVITEISRIVIKRKFNVGEINNQWKHWTVIDSIENIKSYEQIPISKNGKYTNELKEVITEKITVRLLYSKLTFSDKKIISSKRIDVYQPEIFIEDSENKRETNQFN